MILVMTNRNYLKLEHHTESIDFDLGLEAHIINKSMHEWEVKQMVERTRLWAKYFAPMNDVGIRVPRPWGLYNQNSPRPCQV
jgi:hypothetical protein